MQLVRNGPRRVRVAGAPTVLVFVSLTALACSPDRAPDASQEPASQPGAQTPPVVGPSSAGMFVSSCAPCVLRVQEGTSDFTLHFRVRVLPDSARAIDEIRITQRSRPEWTQAFRVSDLAATPPADSFFVGAMDFNFDGYSDLFLATSRGAANTYADYWLYKRTEGAFAYLGNYPMITVDTAQRRLKTYERGGDAGRIYEANQYAFVGDSLTLVESEKQAPTERAGVYRLTVSRRRDGRMEVVRNELVRP